MSNVFDAEQMFSKLLYALGGNFNSRWETLGREYGAPISTSFWLMLE
jgi:hypothetical protein